MPYPGFNVAFLWLNPPSARHDFVNNNPDDNKPDPVTGCTTLYLYYLHDQLGFPINAIIAAGASNLSGVYQNLVGASDISKARLEDFRCDYNPDQAAASLQNKH